MHYICLKEIHLLYTLKKKLETFGVQSLTLRNSRHSSIKRCDANRKHILEKKKYRETVKMMEDKFEGSTKMLIEVLMGMASAGGYDRAMAYLAERLAANGFYTGKYEK